MPAFDVKIKATVVKTVRVEDARDEADATEQAHESFSVLCEGPDENYDEETLSCDQVAGPCPACAGQLDGTLHDDGKGTVSYQACGHVAYCY